MKKRQLLKFYVHRRISGLRAPIGAAALALILAGCGLLLPTPIYETTSVGIAVSSGPSGSLQASFSIGGTGASAARSLGSPGGGAPLGAIVGAPDPADIALVTLAITGEDRFGVFQDPLATATLTLTGGIWQATVDDLPIGPSLSFSVGAFDAGGTELYSGTSTRVLGGAGETINIALYPVTDATPVFFPVIERITRPAEILVNSTETVSIDVSGTADETLSVEFTSGGGSFTPSPGSVALPSSGAGTLDASFAAPAVADPYTHSVRVTNEQNNSVETQFVTAVVWELGPAVVSLGIAPTIIGLSTSRSGNEVSFTATVTDDGPQNELSFAWTFDGGLAFVDPTANPAVLTGYDDSATGTITVTVTDSDTSVVAGGLSTTVSFVLPAGLHPDSVVVSTIPVGSDARVGTSGELVLDIPAGALAAATDVQIEPLTSLETPPGVGFIEGSVYRITPESTVLAVPTRIEVWYDPTNDPHGLAPGDLTIVLGTDIGGGVYEWTEIGSTHDAAGPSLTGDIGNFGIIGVASKAATVQVSPQSINFELTTSFGLSAQPFDVVGLPVSRSLDWTSTNPTVVGVSGNGVIGAVNIGTAASVAARVESTDPLSSVTGSMQAATFSHRRITMSTNLDVHDHDPFPFDDDEHGTFSFYNQADYQRPGSPTSSTFDISNRFNACVDNEVVGRIVVRPDLQPDGRRLYVTVQALLYEGHACSTAGLVTQGSWGFWVPENGSINTGRLRIGGSDWMEFDITFANIPNPVYTGWVQVLVP